MQELHPDNRKTPFVQPVLIATGYLLIFMTISLGLNHPAIRAGFLISTPPSGISFALLTLCGAAYSPLVFVAYFFSWLLIGSEPFSLALVLAALIYTVVNTLAAVLTRRLIGTVHPFATLQRTAVFIFLSIMTAFVAAVCVTLLLLWGGTIPRLIYAPVAFQFWSVETVGNMTVAPFASEMGRLLMRWLANRSRQTPRVRLKRFRAEIVIGLFQGFLLLMTLWVVFMVSMTDNRRVWYLLFLPLIWIILQFGFTGASIAVLTINVGGVVAVGVGRYPLTDTEALRVFMLLTSMAGLTTGAALGELRRAQTALHNRLVMEEQITGLATRFIKLSSEKVDDEIRNAMRDVAVFCEMDSSHLFLFTHNGQQVEKVYEWVSAGVAARAERLESYLPGQLPWLHNQLAQGRAVHFANLDAFPAEAAAETDYLRGQGIRSMVAVPILAGEQLVGSLGFHSQVIERDWADEDVRLFSLLGEIFYGVLERRRSEALARDSDRKFRSIVMQSYDGITIVNELGQVVEWNRGMERIAGLTRTQVLGKYLWDVQHQLALPERRTPEVLAKIKATVQAMLQEDDVSTQNHLTDMLIVQPDGTQRLTQTLLFPVQAARGRLLAAITRDVTDLRARQEELRIHQNRLAEAGRLAHLGHFQIEIPSGKITWSDEAYQIVHMDTQNTLLDLKAMMKMVSLEDQQRMVEMLDTLINSPDTLEYELRIQSSEGASKFLHTICRPVRDANNTLTHIFGTVMDISERKRAEEALRQSEARYRAVVEDQSDLIFRFRPDGTITFVNEAFCRNYAMQRSDLVGKPFFRYTTMPPNAELTSEFAPLKSSRPITYEHQAVLSDGKMHWLQWTDSPILDAHGVVIEYQSAGRDVTQSKRLEQELRYLSTHDALTGIYNRLFFEAELARIQRSRQYPVSILMADVNGLKATNDTRGHQAGDELLLAASRTLNACFRPGDIVARFGGDEFAVLLPGVDARGAREVEQRVRSAVDAYNRSAAGDPLSLSIGIATSARGQSLVELVTRADAFMYRDKLRQKAAGNYQGPSGLAE